MEKLSGPAQMTTPTLTACPACASTETRLSRWRSHDERTGNPGMHPFRCTQCGNRFLARASARTRTHARKWPIAVAGAATLVLLGIIGATLFVVISDDQTAEVAEQIAAGNATLEAARRGDAEAQFRVARAALLDPERSKEATRQAVDWLRRAAESGHTGAMIHLGKLYKSGVGTPQNYELAARWLGEAARAGDAEGMVEFGRLHRSGVGVDPDAVQAYVWFNRAAAGLSMEGVQERDSIALKLAPEDLKRAQALSLEDEVPQQAEAETPPQDDSAAAPTMKASAAPAKAPERGE
jgi:hypothetical protein